jgi:hypothetical protein
MARSERRSSFFTPQVAAIIEKQRPGVDKAPLVGVVLDADVVQAEPLDHGGSLASAVDHRLHDRPAGR